MLCILYTCLNHVTQSTQHAKHIHYTTKWHIKYGDVKHSPMTSADLYFAVNQASSPNCPFLSFAWASSFGNPHTAETIRDSCLLLTFGSAQLE